VWIVGCATGEEAYSIAILLREHMDGMPAAPRVQIFATDLDGRALAVARSGRYADIIARHVTPERLARWFTKEGTTYCVSKALREMCIFSPHSVVRDAPFSRIDLLSCRNLLIYLNSDLQKRIIPIFHFSLRPGGFLFLGNAENVTRHTKLFAPVDRKNRVYRRLETARRVLPDLPLTPRLGLRGEVLDRRPPGPRAAPSGPVGRRAEAIVERYAPAYVVVDDQHEVLRFSGRTGRFLEPASGAASLNLLSLIRKDLRLELRAALVKAAQRERVETFPVETIVDGRVSAVRMIVEPTGERGEIVVLFQDAGPLPALGSGAAHPDAEEHVLRIESELRLAKERLQATIEELESTNEELKASNEEYQSINEELQSANEELETSKEELQSINEELQTVNGELAHRVAELARANSDIRNLLESTQIATLFLDNDLRLRSFTPIATELFHLLDTDIGRPIGHVASRLAYPELQEDVRLVLKTLAPVERPVRADDDRRFIARVLPYRSIDNFIAGAVVTFVDISSAAQAEAALRASDERYRLIVEEARDYAIFTTDHENCIDSWPPGAATVFGWAAEEVLGRKPDFTFTPEDRAERVPGWEFDTARDEGQAPDVRWHMRKDGSRVFIDGSARALHNADGRFRGVLKIGQDTTERRRADERLRESEQRLRSLMEGVPQLVWRADRPGHWSWSSPQWTAYTGLSAEESRGPGWLEALHPEDRDRARRPGARRR
jgi:two-component system CheB/CheR fusion protein